MEVLCDVVFISCLTYLSIFIKVYIDFLVLEQITTDQCLPSVQSIFNIHRIREFSSYVLSEDAKRRRVIIRKRNINPMNIGLYT